MPTTRATTATRTPDVRPVVATEHQPATTSRAGRVALVLSGVALVVYPAVRPYADATGSALEAATAYASTAWVVSHLAAMVGLALLPVGLVALRDHVAPSPAARAAVISATAGTALVLPYYGIETFALRAVGQRVLDSGDLQLLGLVDAVRDGSTQIMIFGVGLVLLAVSGVLAGVATWRSGTVDRWAALPLATGIVLLLPQFYAAPALRVAHGVLVGAGCVVLAWRLRTARRA